MPRVILDCAGAGSSTTTSVAGNGGWPSVPSGLITFGLVDLAVVVWAGIVAVGVILLLLRLSERRSEKLQPG